MGVDYLAIIYLRNRTNTKSECKDNGNNEESRTEIKKSFLTFFCEMPVWLYEMIMPKACLLRVDYLQKTVGLTGRPYTLESAV